MKLSKREMKLLTDIEKSRKYRKLGAWINLLLIPIAWRIYPEVTGIVTAIVTVHLIHFYIGIRPDDQLIDLLQRYINSDAEAIQQLSNSSDTRGSAA